MRRVYTDVSAFRGPYSSTNVSFAGLGADGWPPGRSYISQHFFRAPYQNGYYQSNALRGMGAAGDVPPLAGLLLCAVLIGGAVVVLAGGR